MNNHIHNTEKQKLALLNPLDHKSFIHFLQINSMDWVLHVGCGAGTLTREIANKFPHVKVVGIEHFKKQLSWKNTNKDLFLIQAKFHTLPLAPNSFDVVYCYHLLEYVENPEKILQQMYKVLKPQGKIFLQENNILVHETEPDCPHFLHIWRKWAQWQKKLGKDTLIGKKLFPLLQQTGFSQIELSIVPEIHCSGKETFAIWLKNIIANIKENTKELEKRGFITKQQLATAIKELKNLLKQKNSSIFFYRNRAYAIKSRPILDKKNNKFDHGTQ